MPFRYQAGRTSCRRRTSAPSGRKWRSDPSSILNTKSGHRCRGTGDTLTTESQPDRAKDGRGLTNVFGRPQRRCRLQKNDQLRLKAGGGLVSHGMPYDVAHRGRVGGNVRRPHERHKSPVAPRDIRDLARVRRNHDPIERSRDCLAVSIVQAIRGLPRSGLVFFPGRPFEPPRAGIRASVVIRSRSRHSGGGPLPRIRRLPPDAPGSVA